jgi:hypothetical protein
MLRAIALSSSIKSTRIVQNLFRDPQAVVNKQEQPRAKWLTSAFTVTASFIGREFVLIESDPDLAASP